MTLRAAPLLVALWLSAAPAVAAEVGSCRPHRPWVEVRIDEIASPLRAFVPLLRAELASRGIEVCGSGGDGPPIATIDASSNGDAVTLAVESTGGGAPARREIAVAGIPPDSQPLTIALAADELLRAELAAKATAPPLASLEPAPPHDTGPTAPRHPTLELAAGFALEQYTHGLTLYGADVRAGGWVVSRLELAGDFGMRGGPSVTGPDGTAQPTAWTVDVEARVTITPLDWRLGIDLTAALGVEHVTFAPTPTDGATGSEESGVAWLAMLGPNISVAVVPGLRIGAEALAVAPVRGVDADDAGKLVAGLSGVGWCTRLQLSTVLF